MESPAAVKTAYSAMETTGGRSARASKKGGSAEAQASIETQAITRSARRRREGA